MDGAFLAVDVNPDSSLLKKKTIRKTIPHICSNIHCSANRLWGITFGSFVFVFLFFSP